MSEHVASGPPHVHHMDAKTAYSAAKLGMWLFLATEILLFGGLFAGFAIYRWQYLSEFAHASEHLNWKMGALNTAILIFSSYAVVLGVDAAQHGENKKVKKWMLVTLLCGCGFLVVKFFEYKSKYEHGLFPGTVDHITNIAFNSPEFNAQYKMFFGLYYCMTGLHALHVIIGMGIIFWIYLLAKKNRFSTDYYTPVEVGGLYWHLIDLIWIYLFPLLYLVG